MRQSHVQSGFILWFLSVSILLVATIAVGAGFFANQYFSRGPATEKKVVMISSGMGISAIADLLAEEGVIELPLLFKIAAKLDPDKAYLKAGEYEFVAGMPMSSVLQQIKDGEVVDRRITVREGLTSHQIVEILKAEEALIGDIIDIPKEGSLLPETYHFTKGDSRLDKLKQMQVAMRAVIDELWPGRKKGLPFETKDEAIILASIVEKETGVGLERAKVAGVFINRLKKGMVLQTDPTVIYAITKGKFKNEGKGPLGRRLLRKDLEIDNPYNTYKYAGLPPGPIANPGKASIEAVLNPDEHDYIYFVADGTGGHAFAKTLSEHNRNVAKWRQIRRSQQ